MTSGRKTPEERQRAFESARLIATRAWAFVGCALAFVIALAALGSVESAVQCVLVGGFVGFVCSSMTNWLERHGVSRAVGALIALAVVIAVLVGLALWLMPLFVSQLMQLLERLPGLLAQAQDSVQALFATFGSERTAEIQTNVQGFVGMLSDVGTSLTRQLASWLSTAFVPNVMGIANDLVMFFLGLVMAYWFAKDYPALMREFGVIAGPRHDEDLSLLVAVLGRAVGGYMRGIVITSVLNGVLAFAGFALCGHPYAGLMGIFVGLLHFVPVVGPAVSALMATLTALFASPAVAFWTLVVSVVAQNVVDNLVSPLVMQSSVKIHPAMSLIGITMGASLGGAVGMALAVPLTAAVKGAFVYYFESKTGRQLVSFDGAFFKGTPYHHADGSPVPSFDALDDDTFLADSRLVEADGIADAQAEESPEHEATLADKIRETLVGGDGPKAS